MTGLTYYHKLISKSLAEIKTLNSKVDPLIMKYQEEFKVGDVSANTLKKLLKHIDLEKAEYDKIDKLIRDIQEDAKDYYENLV
jgi:hypothetical protein